MSIEVMKQALEALHGSIAITMAKIDLRNKAIKALEEALKQEQGEPVGEAYLCDQCSTPFDGAYECPSCGHNTSTKEPVYTTPQQRTWIGLTDDEMNMLGDKMKTWSVISLKDIYIAIEAKLKEKNA
jgi:DNA-directed RNA polymerase subunit RPC12/RpoP